ncbi:alpha/beta hydrolase [Martelella mediterranea]|uniref:Alpha/beta hydrolase family protein n=1 Tax=Martelella mediterranea DSM 17316 TaxID=1122214 RepID=A0A1U9Z1E3_9HYPH|nr:alpha/beta fold hydrolase [Martelella mediterranea]AQZ51470.1 Alpha/beta hydrolase family protein [Martelella mediterranea DSM 17316]
MSDVVRKDFHVKTVDGYSVAIREVRSDRTDRVPMILLHGTRIPGLSEFDLPVEHGSLAADLAAKGHVVYILDARGFGRSERPAAMDEPPVPGADPLVRTIEITRDVDAAVDHLRAATGNDKVGLFGWGVGGTCCGMYAALWPEKISHIVLYTVIYGGAGDQPSFQIGSIWDDPDNPGHFNQKRFGNYTFNSLEVLDRHWNEQIPIADKDSWRDPAMFEAFRQALIDGDPTAMDRDPPSYRSPNGMLEDLYRMGCNAQKLFHASQIYCKVMIVKPEFDTLCTPADLEALVADLEHAEAVDVWAEKNTTHYVLLDRPERGRDDLLARMDAFLR